jgi:hypothetical protein
MRSVIVSIFIFACLCSPSYSAVHYVDPAATGTDSGADWTNAFPAIPATLTRGDTYYLAEGDYGIATFEQAVSSTLVITVKKCGLGDGICEGAAGYTLSNHDGVAEFYRINVKTSYWIFDGTSGGGSNSWESGFGFKIYNQDWDHEGALISNATISSISNVTFRHIEITCNAASGPPYATGVYWPQTASYITFSYCYIHDIPGDMFQIRQWNNFTWEYSKMARNWQDETRHGDGFEHDGTGSNFVVRGSFFEDLSATYICGHHDTGDLTGYEIYNNIFYWTDGTAASTDNGIIATTSGTGTINNLKVYNNTFANMQAGNGGINLVNPGTGNEAKNNIFYVPDGYTVPVGFNNVTHDYNWFYNSGIQTEDNKITGTAIPFVEMASRNFALKSTATAINTGTDLSAYFTTDIIGTSRTQNGAFDIGAYEYFTTGAFTGSMN